MHFSRVKNFITAFENLLEYSKLKSSPAKWQPTVKNHLKLVKIMAKLRLGDPFPPLLIISVKSSKMGLGLRIKTSQPTKRTKSQNCVSFCDNKILSFIAAFMM